MKQYHVRPNPNTRIIAHFTSDTVLTSSPPLASHMGIRDASRRTPKQTHLPHADPQPETVKQTTSTPHNRLPMYLSARKSHPHPHDSTRRHTHPMPQPIAPTHFYPQRTQCHTSSPKTPHPKKPTPTTTIPPTTPATPSYLTLHQNA